MHLGTFQLHRKSNSCDIQLHMGRSNYDVNMNRVQKPSKKKLCFVPFSITKKTHGIFLLVMLVYMYCKCCTMRTCIYIPQAIFLSYWIHLKNNNYVFPVWYLTDVFRNINQFFPYQQHLACIAPEYLQFTIPKLQSMLLISQSSSFSYTDFKRKRKWQRSKKLWNVRSILVWPAKVYLYNNSALTWWYPILWNGLNAEVLFNKTCPLITTCVDIPYLFAV